MHKNRHSYYQELSFYSSFLFFLEANATIPVTRTVQAIAGMNGWISCLHSEISFENRLRRSFIKE
ncbi:hypothetical protein HMPREF9182_0679 [Streptococcus sp. oral taxon 056 str. F0418]|nr:hypothetical protein HMPREF9182_0679 [Streptococcus sp. oral taxon 056 str. F0418]